MNSTPPFVRYTVTLQALQPVAWPHHAGSALRGAFGHALRHTACVTGQPACNGCPLRQHCAYSAVFEPLPPSAPLHPSFRNGIPRYTVQSTLGARSLRRGERLNWALLLLPGAEAHRPSVEHALRHRLGQHLLRPGDLQTVHIEAAELSWPHPDATACPPAATADAGTTGVATSGPVTDVWHLQLHTPLRLQKGGHPLRQARDLSADTLVRAALRRQLQACQLAGLPAPDPAPALQAAARCQTDTQHIRWHELQRHSARQGRQVPLGGLIGPLRLHGPADALACLQPLMALAQQMHLGKETMVGLGQISGVPGYDPALAP